MARRIIFFLQRRNKTLFSYIIQACSKTVVYQHPPTMPWEAPSSWVWKERKFLTILEAQDCATCMVLLSVTVVEKNVGSALIQKIGKVPQPRTLGIAPHNLSAESYGRHKWFASIKRFTVFSPWPIMIRWSFERKRMARNHRSGGVSNRLETTSRGQILQRRSTVSCVPRVVAMGGVSGSLHPPVAPNHGGGGGMLGSFVSNLSMEEPTRSVCKTANKLNGTLT